MWRSTKQIWVSVKKFHNVMTRPVLPIPYPSLKDLQTLDPAYFGLSEIWRDLKDGGMGNSVEFAGK